FELAYKTELSSPLDRGHFLYYFDEKRTQLPKEVEMSLDSVILKAIDSFFEKMRLNIASKNKNFEEIEGKKTRRTTSVKKPTKNPVMFLSENVKFLRRSVEIEVLKWHNKAFKLKSEPSCAQVKF